MLFFVIFIPTRHTFPHLNIENLVQMAGLLFKFVYFLGTNLCELESSRFRLVLQKLHWFGW